MRRRAWRRTGASSAGPHVYSRTDNALSSLWKASFAGSPWTPSAGANGNLVTGVSAGDTAPTVGSGGALQNGLAPAVFDGAHSAFLTEATIGDLFTAAAGAFWILFYATVAGSAPGAPYNESALLMDTGGDYFALSYTTSGLRFTLGDSGGYKSTSYVACATGAVNLVQCKWDSTNAKLRLDGAAAVPVGCGALANVTRGLRVGANYSGGGLYFGGRILEIGTKAYAPTAAEEDDDRADIDTVYGLSL